MAKETVHARAALSSAAACDEETHKGFSDLGAASSRLQALVGIVSFSEPCAKAGVEEAMANVQAEKDHLQHTCDTYSQRRIGLEARLPISTFVRPDESTRGNVE